MNRTAPPLPKSDPPLREARIAGARLTFTDEGAGPLVLMAVHGVPGSVRDFRYMGPPLSEFARLIRVDLPGSGGSEPRLDALRRLEARAETVLALADHLGLATFGVIGHSMGAATALVTAAAANARVSHLVLVAPIGLRPHRGLRRSPAYFRRLALMLRIPGLRQLLVPAMRRHYRKKRFPGAEAMTADDFRVQTEALTAADYPLLNRAATSPLAARTLVAYADDDHLVEPEIPAELAATIPGARALRFPDGGHVIQKNKAREIAAAIREL